MKTGIILVLFQFLVPASLAQSDFDFRKKNVAYYYHPGSEIRLEYNLARKNNGIVLYLNVVTLEGVGLRNNYTISYELRKDYMDLRPVGRDTIPYHELLFRRHDEYIFREDIELSGDAELVIVHVTNRHTGNVFTFDIPMVNEFVFPKGELIIRKEGLPVFTEFVSAQDTIEIVTVADSAAELVYAYRYNTSFNPADPPMAEVARAVREDLKIDTILALDLNTSLQLDKEGLYFIQKDTATLIGSGVLAKDMFFPRLAAIGDVVQPLIYITTRSEREKLMKAPDKKKALDRFWLDLVKSPNRAKGLIRSYYRRVGDANSYFTTYKEGWKTDRGMIYILFGPPDEVYRDEEKEEWIYRKIEDIPGLSFPFVKVKNIFSRNHYTLLRDSAYEKRWYRIVDLWRKGRFAGASDAN